MSQPWPPPPDLASLKELFATADIEGLIADAAPPDEYDPEAQNFFAAIDGLPTADITAPQMLAVLERIWTSAFNLDESELQLRSSALRALADQVARFFGPEAVPQVRGAQQ